MTESLSKSETKEIVTPYAFTVSAELATPSGQGFHPQQKPSIQVRSDADRCHRPLTWASWRFRSSARKCPRHSRRRGRNPMPTVPCRRLPRNPARRRTPPRSQTPARSRSPVHQMPRDLGSRRSMSGDIRSTAFVTPCWRSSHTTRPMVGRWRHSRLPYCHYPSHTRR